MVQKIPNVARKRSGSGIGDCDKRGGNIAETAAISGRAREYRAAGNPKQTGTNGEKVLFFVNRAAEVDIFAKIGYNTQKIRHVPFSA